MRGINYKTALGTILLFIGFFCLKAAFQKNKSAHSTEMKTSTKMILIISGILAMAAGVFLIVKSVMKIYS